MLAEDSLTLPIGSYLSDEADRRYPLLRIEREDSDRVYVFAPIPTTTRIFDVIAERQRWMGVHSAIRALRFPAVRGGYDITIIPDSIEINVPLYREYVAWKWKGRSKRTELPASPDVPQQKPRPLSRFEQKMLQESRTRGN